MSVTELYNLVSNITTTLNRCIQICESATDAQFLPKPIQVLSSQLPWIRAAFDKAREGFPSSGDGSPDIVALEKILKDCAGKSSSLEDALRLIIPRADSSTLESSRPSAPNEDEVVLLKDGIFSGLKDLAGNPAIEAETRDNVRTLVGFVTQEPGYNLWGASDND